MLKEKKKKTAPLKPRQIPHPYNGNLVCRNKALLWALGGFSILLYLISFVRMGQW